MSSSISAKFRSPSGRGHPPSGRHRGKRWTLWHWTFLLLCFALTGVAVLALLEFVVWSKVPPALVGKWQIREGTSAAVFQFSRNGELQVSVNRKQSQSRVEVQDKTMFTTVFIPGNMQEETHKSTILELTAESLVLEKEDGTVLKLVRIK